MKKLLNLSLLSLFTSTTLYAEQIQVLSAVTKDKNIANAEVIVQQLGQTSKITYYNIAKVYEGKREYRKALEAYKEALVNKEHPAYHKGIARMQRALGL